MEAVMRTRSANITLFEGPIVQVEIHPDIKQSIADAHENVRVTTELAGTRRPRVLVDLTRAQPVEAEVRQVYRGEGCRAFAALAFVVANHPLGRMIGNIYLRVARPAIPSRLFTDTPKAIEWLRELDGT